MHYPTPPQRGESSPPPNRAPAVRLPWLLWLLWATIVLSTGYISWQTDLAAGRPLNMLGIAIHSTLAGMIGLLVLTWLEVRLTGGLDT